MILTLGFKTPDVLEYALEGAGVSDKDQREDIKTIAEQWVKFGEYITIEIDTNTNTATIVRNQS